MQIQADLHTIKPINRASINPDWHNCERYLECTSRIAHDFGPDGTRARERANSSPPFGKGLQRVHDVVYDVGVRVLLP